MDSDNKWRTFPTDPRLETFPTDPRLKPFSVAAAARAPTIASSKSPPDGAFVDASDSGRNDTGRVLKTLWDAPGRRYFHTPGHLLSPLVDASRDPFHRDLQLAVDSVRAGGIVWMPPSVFHYEVKRPPLVVPPGVSLVGGGPRTVVSLPVGSEWTLEPLIACTSPGAVEWTTRLEGFRLDGHRPAGSARVVAVGISIVGTGYPLLLRDLEVGGFSIAGVDISGNTAPIRLDDVSVQDCFCGLRLSAATSIHARATQVGPDCYVGVYAWGTGNGDLRFRECAVRECPLPGFWLDGVSGLSLESCRLEHNGAAVSGSLPAAQVAFGYQTECRGVLVTNSCFVAVPWHEGARGTAAVYLRKVHASLLLANEFRGHRPYDVHLSGETLFTRVVPGTAPGEEGPNVLVPDAAAGTTRLGGLDEGPFVQS